MTARAAGRFAGAVASLTLVCALSLNGTLARAQEKQPTHIGLEAPQPVHRLLIGNLDLPLERETALDTGERAALVRRARREIGELLATEGYFRPALEVHTDPATGDRPVRMTIVVHPGNQARITEARIEFAGDIAAGGEAREARIETLRAAWPLKPGEPFRQASWSEAKQRLLVELQAQDYPAAALSESLAEVDPERDAVRLHVRYDSGPAFTIGSLEVSGLQNYGPDLIERYNTLRPGERYDQQQLLQLQSTLQNTPYFSSVLVDVDADPAKAERTPVRVLVREGKPKRLGLGVGYSTNTGARAEINYRDAAILGRPWSLNSALRLEQLRQSAFADIFLPPNPGGYRDSFGALYERTDIQNLVTRRRVVGAVRTRLKGNIETRIAVNLEDEERTAGTSAPTTRQALTLNWSWTWRDVDELFDPRRGNVLNVQLGGATKLLLSDQNFVRSYARYQRFQPVGESDVLILRAEAGYTAAPSRDGIPQEFVFRSGGAQSVRGYAYQSLGVKEAEATVGGRYLAVGSIEYVHWFAAQWGAAAFYDVGNATDELRDFRLLSGVGVGVRWRSPAGPLAFDLAYGVDTRKLRPHFSLAIAF
jgi:translocation and assembly module TamA